MTLRKRFHEGKKSLKQNLLFVRHGLPYTDFRRMCAGIRQYSNSSKNILWIGAFPPRHRNVGDHAQTVAVDRFFKQHFDDCNVIRMNRSQVETDLERVRKLARSFSSKDIVIIHSSGDFGSHHYRSEGCWHTIRREIVDLFQQSTVVNLPTTVFYGSSKDDQQVFVDDKKIFGRKNFALLCREQVSLSGVEGRLPCRCEFFPDFVFYLQRPPTKKKREGVLVVLRSDSEAKLKPDKRQTLIDVLKKGFPVVDEMDILNAKFPVYQTVEDKFVSHIQDLYEKYELVITDRMHGMILAVTTNTPCLALDSGIPHKINAYREFLSPAVTFSSEGLFTLDQIKEVISSRKESPDLMPFYETFRSKFIDGLIESAGTN